MADEEYVDVIDNLDEEEEDKVSDDDGVEHVLPPPPDAWAGVVVDPVVDPDVEEGAELVEYTTHPAPTSDMVQVFQDYPRISGPATLNNHLSRRIVHKLEEGTESACILDSSIAETEQDAVPNYGAAEEKHAQGWSQKHHQLGEY